MWKSRSAKSVASGIMGSATSGLSLPLFQRNMWQYVLGRISGESQVSKSRWRDHDEILGRLVDRIDALERVVVQARQNGIAAGELPTGKSTTPTCAPIGSVSLDSSVDITLEMKRAGVAALKATNSLSAPYDKVIRVYRAMEAKREHFGFVDVDPPPEITPAMIDAGWEAAYDVLKGQCVAYAALEAIYKAMDAAKGKT